VCKHARWPSSLEWIECGCKELIRRRIRQTVVAGANAEIRAVRAKDSVARIGAWRAAAVDYAMMAGT
jgi:hypothetical protein